MILSWFDAREAKQFGESLARFYMERISPNEAADKKDLAKRKEALNKLFQQLARYRLEHKMNIYKQAQLGNVFKWTLKEAGYDPIYVDHLTTELMTLR